MRVKRVMQWAILAVCAAASLLNILYLSGVLSQHAATYGFLLVLACFAAHLLLKKQYADAPAAPDTRLERLRGGLTALFAVLWLVTSGLAMVWMRQ